MIILKEEINHLAGQIFDLAKWKLIVVGSFALVGLGWGEIKPDETTGLLLLYSVGYLCAYLDSLYFRRATVIHVIASYLRGYEGKDAEMKELREYENIVSEVRDKNQFFISDSVPQFAASLIFTIGLPLMGMIRYQREADSLLIIPIVATLLSISLFVAYLWNRGGLITRHVPEKESDESDSGSQSAAEADSDSTTDQG